MISIYALGSLSVDGLATRRRLALVAGEKRLALFLYLLLHGRGGVIRRDLILPLLWPEADESRARSALRSLVREVRSAVGDGVVVSEGDHALGVDVTKVRCDVLAFEAACVKGEWERAVELYRGRLLDGFGVSGAAGFEEWLEGERGRLAAQALEACRVLATEARARGARDTAVRALRKALTISPYDERVMRELMEMLAEVGDRAGALVAHEEFVAKLKAELDAEPGAETVAVAEGVRAWPGRVGEQRSRSAISDAKPFAASDDPKRRVLARLAIGVIAVLAITAGAVSWRALHTRPPAELPRLVVLPFDDRSPDAEEYFADGMTEAVTTRLAALSGLMVIATTSATQYRNTDRTPQEIGVELEVDYVLHGTIQRERVGDAIRVRVSSQLIGVVDAAVAWAHAYEEPLGSMFALQTAIAEHVAEALNVALSAGERSALTSFPTTNPEAWDYYTRGQHFFSSDNSQEGSGRAAEMFRRATVVDTSFALGYAMLSQALGAIGDSVGARRAVDKALVLDPRLPEARLSLGQIHYIRRDWDAAFEAFSAVLAERPSNSMAHYYLAITLRRQGRYEESVEEFELVAKLDPVSPGPRGELALTLHHLGRYDEADAYAQERISQEPGRASNYVAAALIALRRDGDLEQFHRVLRETADLLGMSQVLSALLWHHTYLPAFELLDSHFHEAFLRIPRIALEAGPWRYYWARATVHDLRGEAALAHAYYDSLRLEFERVPAATASPPTHLPHGALGIAYAGLGRPAEAVEHGREGVKLLPTEVDGWDGPDSVEWLARIYVMIGEYESAIEQLEILVSLFPGDADEIRINPFYDPLRGYPRFQALVANGAS